MGRKKKNPLSFVGNNSSHHHQLHQPHQQNQQEKELEDSQLHTEQDHQWQGLKDVMLPLLRGNDKGKEVISIDDDDDEEEEEEEEGKNQENEDEFIEIEESIIQKYLTCPICLGIMQQTHAVKECLHRFCKDCIDKSMRVVNRECPACRKHLPSKRTLRKDTRYDRIIQEFYPNINDDNYGEMDLEEEERAQNEQIQTSFAETYQRQSESLPRRLAQQTPLSSRSISQGTDEDEDGQSNDVVRDSSSADQSFSLSDNGWELNQNDEDGERTIPSTEVFKWGRNGQRSQTRRDIGSSSTRKSRGKHLAQVTKRIDNIRLNPEEVEISVALIPLNEQTLPSLESPYITCPSIFSVKQLRQYVANQMGVQVKEVEISLVTAPTFPTSGLMPVYDPARGDLLLLQSQETVGALHHCYSPDGALVLGYQRKLSQ